MDLSNVRVVFFDVHETLIHIALTPPEIFHTLCEEVGADVSLSAIQEIYPNPESLEQRRDAYGDDVEFWRNFNNQLVANLGLSDPNGELEEFITTGFLRDTWWRAYEDAEPVLQALKSNGFKLGVIANARNVVLGRLEHVGLSSYFDAIVYSEGVGSKKPEAKIFEIALGEMGCNPSDAVHIGDRTREDVEGARTAGITPVLIDRENQHSNFDGLKVSNLSEFAKLLT